MTSPTSEGQHSGLDPFFSAVRGIGIRRRTDNKWVGGVCSGIATRLRIDPVVVRAGLILLILFGGVGIAAYLVAWVLLPDSQDRIAAERALRDGDAGSIVLLVVAAIALFSGFPWWFGGHDGAWGFPWGLLVLAAIVWVVVRRSRNGGHAGTPPVSPSAGADIRLADRVAAVRPVGRPVSRPVSRPRAGDVTDVAGPGRRQLGRSARRGRRQVGRAARRAGRRVGRAAGNRPPVPAPLRRPADDARRGRPGDGGLRRHAVARRPARLFRRPPRDRAGCDAGRPRAARPRARCGRLADRVRRCPRHPHGARDARLRGRGRRRQVGRPGRRRHLDPHGGRPGRRPQQLPDRRRGRPASTCGACRSTVWPTPPSPPGWGWAS